MTKKVKLLSAAILMSLNHFSGIVHANEKTDSIEVPKEGFISFTPSEISEIVCWAVGARSISSFASVHPNTDGTFEVVYFFGFAAKSLELKASYRYYHPNGRSAGYEFPEIFLKVSENSVPQIDHQPHDFGLTIAFKDHGRLTGIDNLGYRELDIEGIGTLRHSDVPLICSAKIKP